MGVHDYVVVLTREARRRQRELGESSGLESRVAVLPDVEVVGGNGRTTLHVRMDSGQLAELKRQVSDIAVVQEETELSFF